VIVGTSGIGVIGVISECSWTVERDDGVVMLVHSDLTLLLMLGGSPVIRAGGVY
jgi:hypothetical protein